MRRFFTEALEGHLLFKIYYLLPIIYNLSLIIYRLLLYLVLKRALFDRKKTMFTARQISGKDELEHHL
jgi:hypothetical protein